MLWLAQSCETRHAHSTTHLSMLPVDESARRVRQGVPRPTPATMEASEGHNSIHVPSKSPTVRLSVFLSVCLSVPLDRGRALTLECIDAFPTEA